MNQNTPQDVAIVAAARTPIGKAGKAYAQVHPVDLLATALGAAVQRSGLSDATEIDQVLVGCVQQAGAQSTNIGRNAALTAGLPLSVPGATIDAQCGSSQHATNLAATQIMAGHSELVLCGGVEMLSRVPNNQHRALGSPYSDALLHKYAMPDQGDAVELMADKYAIDRGDADAFGVRSHRRADAGWTSGAFTAEIVEHRFDGRPLLERDEGIRADSSIERAAGLTPVYRDDGIVTAASSSQLSDGSAALLLAGSRAVDRLDLKPLAWIRHTCFAGTDPELMLEGPIAATEKLLARTGLSITDFDLIEIHEAYAVVVLSWLMQFPETDPERINVNGGAIALGHPFGASGARQLVHLAQRMHATGARLGLQIMCCGGGIGTGTVLERPESPRGDARPRRVSALVPSP